MDAIARALQHVFSTANPFLHSVSVGSCLPLSSQVAVISNVLSWRMTWPRISHGDTISEQAARWLCMAQWLHASYGYAWCCARIHAQIHARIQRVDTRLTKWR